MSNKTYFSVMVSVFVLSMCLLLGVVISGTADVHGWWLVKYNLAVVLLSLYCVVTYIMLHPLFKPEEKGSLNEYFNLYAGGYISGRKFLNGLLEPRAFFDLFIIIAGLLISVSFWLSLNIIVNDFDKIHTMRFILWLSVVVFSMLVTAVFLKILKRGK